MEENKTDKIETENKEEKEVKKVEKKSIRIADKVFKEIGEWAICIFIAFFIAISLKYFIGTFTTVKQLSMDPTLKQNDRLWLDRTVRSFKGEYKVGDIVTFEAPNMDLVEEVGNRSPEAKYTENKSFTEKFVKNFLEIGKTSYIKRVIAKEGDHVQIENGQVFVNGELFNEEYLGPEIVTETPNLTDFIVPENTLFLMGDNRSNSTDSRKFGCIPLRKMEGKIVSRVLPFKSMGKIPNTYDEIKNK